MLPFSRYFCAMTIEGLGKKFQEARLARNLTLDEAARMTKIRPARLAEIEAARKSQGLVRFTVLDAMHDLVSAVQ